ncbi:helix-turn-helix transcriptional regulator [Paenibacillus agricola]|uniref:Helix-turn-helix transcriptional regulator n=1 Tax=Paenibacillus agricola TaxID=2716264 RepID=A0ABX0J4I7_9BACL|nr:helix-turn-helix transcriptional regulator [Paenibacillus agricola]NHN30331.1 helix-turn-helix transcriptional regulator [Paenibacillus agricola]
MQEYSYTKEKELYDTFKSASDSTEIQHSIETFYDFFVQNGSSEMFEMYETTVRLLVGIEKRVVAEFGKDSKCNKLEVMSVVNKTNLEEVKAYVLECFMELRGIILRKFNHYHTSIILKTIQHMENEFQHATLDSLAQKVFMTPSYLSMLFKSNTGKTFIEQLTEIRIDKAKQLLKNTHLKNYEVAESIGYQDSRYFSQIFKKKVGLSPSDYRESATN